MGYVVCYIKHILGQDMPEIARHDLTRRYTDGRSAALEPKVVNLGPA